MFNFNAVFLSQETVEEFEKLFVENEVLKDSVAGLQKKYKNVAETNEVGEGKHLCIVNTSKRMTKTKTNKQDKLVFCGNHPFPVAGVLWPFNMSRAQLCES